MGATPQKMYVILFYLLQLTNCRLFGFLNDETQDSKAHVANGFKIGLKYIYIYIYIYINEAGVWWMHRL